MKIGIDVTPILYEGTGIGQYTKQLVKHLLAQNPEDDFVLFYSTLRGYGKIRNKITEIAASPSAPRNDKIRIVGLPLPPAFWQIVWNRFNLIKIEWLIGRVDVFHCWDYLIPPSDCPRVVTIHDITPILYPETHIASIVYNFKIVLEKIRREKITVLTVSENSRNDLIRHCKLNEQQAYVVYNGKDESVACEVATKNQYGDYVLFVGTREPRKNISKAIEAFTLLAKKYSRLQLMIVGKYGWGKEDESVNFRTYESRIKKMGYVKRKDLVRLYVNAICLVYPSLYEGFGLPVLEAMNLGCPVVTSNISSLPEIGGAAVVYVNPQNVQEIAAAAGRFIESNELRQEYIKKGHEQAKKFSWEKCARGTKNIYKKIITT